MENSGRGRSPELDQVRRLLFPDLPSEEGWARIDEARSGASDPERWAKIEDIARGDLPDDLFARLRELLSRRDEDPDETSDDDE
jgi:hypothetical protein